MLTSVLATTSRRVVQRGAAVAIRHGGMARLSQQLQQQPSAAVTAHCFSTKGASSSGGIRSWMEGRKNRKEHEQYMEQMERLSAMEALTLENYQGELKRNLNWFANLSVMQTKEVKIAKEVAEVVGNFIDVLGKDAKADDLINMDRMQRLKVANSSKKALEEIAILVSQIQNMDLMQRTLKKRRDEGKPIPKDAEAMQAAIKKDALSLMSKSQKDMMKTRQAALAKKHMRRRR